MAKRKLYIDILRYLACFLVVGIHVSAVFILIKCLFEDRYENFVLPNYTYGIYMIYLIKILWTGFLNIPTIRNFAIIDIPINILLTFAISLIVVMLTKKLKVFSKYLYFL